MVTKEVLAGVLPSVTGNNELLIEVQGEKDLIREILKAHNEFARDYDRIYRYFVKDTVYGTGKEIWNFLKYQFDYTAESEGDQTVKTPGRILIDGEKIDCKHYSLFSGGILDAIKRNEGVNIDWCYRFASYDRENVASHVFTVINDNGREIWLDPVLNGYNQKKYPNFKTDRKPKAVYVMNGINEYQGKPSYVGLGLAALAILLIVQYNK